MYFAKLNKDGIVEAVIVADEEFVKTLPGTYVETTMDRSKRKNYAGIGYKYDKHLDAFIPPKPFQSWVLDVETCRYKAPTEIPEDSDAFITWDEKNKGWKRYEKFIDKDKTS